MAGKAVDPLFGDGWPRLEGRSPGEAAWSRLRTYTDVPKGVGIPADELLYVAVDNVFEGAARLVVSRWPKRGRDAPLTFGKTVATWVNAKSFGELASRYRSSPAAETLRPEQRLDFLVRPISGGDVFACRMQRDMDLAELAALEPGEWMTAPFVDITAEMREAAKAAFYAAVAPTLAESELRKLHGAD
jgi:hypothetical protein